MACFLTTIGYKLHDLAFFSQRSTRNYMEIETSWATNYIVATWFFSDWFLLKYFKKESDGISDSWMLKYRLYFETTYIQGPFHQKKSIFFPVVRSLWNVDTEVKIGEKKFTL